MSQWCLPSNVVTDAENTVLILLMNIGRHKRSCLVFARERQNKVDCGLVINHEEKIIRNRSIDTTISQLSLKNSLSNLPAAVIRSSKIRGSISGITIATYLGVFLFVITMIAIAYHPPVNRQALAEASVNSSVQQTQTTSTVSVDKLVATDLASSLAESTDMPVSNYVTNLSQSLAVESALAQSNANVISKPTIVQPTADGRTIQHYTSVAGDTVPAIASKYGISSQTVEWANNLTSEALTPGTTLTILPVDGVLYTVKSGDTIDSIVAKYGTDRASLIAYNDLELTGNPTAGVQLVLPGAVLPTNERPGYTAPRVRSSYYGGGYGSSYMARASVGNRYAWGNCTWYAYERRTQLGEPVGSFWGNANTWAYNARSAGLVVDGNPTPGSVMQNGGGYGHVAIVESVSPGVSVTISEMNGYRFGGGFNRVGHGDISWSEATSGYFRYIH